MTLPKMDDKLKEYVRTHKTRVMFHTLWMLPYLVWCFFSGVVEGVREEWNRQRRGK